MEVQLEDDKLRTRRKLTRDTRAAPSTLQRVSHIPWDGDKGLSMAEKNIYEK